MTIQQLRTFMAVVEQRSFCRAADTLFMTQASVSQQITALERYYQVRLFIRVGRRFSITPEGQALYAATKDILERLDAIPKTFAALRRLESGELRIAASTLTGSYLLPALLREYKRKFPQIAISIQTGYGHEMVERVRQKQVDLAFVGRNLNWTADRTLQFQALGQDRLALIVWPGHPWCNRSQLSAEELAASPYPFIHSRPHSAMRSMVEEYLRQENITLVSTLELGNHEPIKRAVAEEIGIALISQTAIQQEIENGRLVQIPLRGLDQISRDFVLVSLHNKTFSYAEQAFITILQHAVTAAASFH